MLEPIRELLDAGIQSDRVDRDESWNTTLREQLQLSEVTVSTILARKTINLRQLTHLKVGDVLPIELPKSVPICVEDIPLFTGEFGISNGQNAVKITATHPPGTFVAKAQPKDPNA
jgi:flagellar motor switch protein FliM